MGFRHSPRINRKHVNIDIDGMYVTIVDDISYDPEARSMTFPFW